MPGEFSLELRSRSRLQQIASDHGAALSVVDCRPFDRLGMVMLLEVQGPSDAQEAAFRDIRALRGVRRAHVSSIRGEATRVFLVVDKPGVCRAAGDAAILCLDCPFDSTQAPAKWRFIAESSDDAVDIIKRLGEEGIRARLSDITPTGSVTLNDMERGVISVAIERGYYDFPRKIDLRTLGGLVGLEEEKLRAVLRKVE